MVRGEADGVIAAHDVHDEARGRRGHHRARATATRIDGDCNERRHFAATGTPSSVLTKRRKREAASRDGEGFSARQRYERWKSESCIRDKGTEAAKEDGVPDSRELRQGPRGSPRKKSRAPHGREPRRKQRGNLEPAEEDGAPQSRSCVRESDM